MKKLFFLSFILCCAIGLTAQTTFNPSTDYMFADFELDNNVKILDADGVPTSANAINGGWGLSGTQVNNTNPRSEVSGSSPVSAINSSNRTFSFAVANTNASGGIYINIRDWSGHSIHSYNSMRLKLHTMDVNLVGTVPVDVRVGVGQFGANGGLRESIKATTVTFPTYYQGYERGDWIEFTYDISSLRTPAEIDPTKPTPWEYVDVVIANLPTTEWGKTFRIDEIIFSSAGLTTVTENRMNSNYLVSYDRTNHALNIADNMLASEILVYNTLGQIVKRAEQVSRLDISGMDPGVYIANALVDGKKQSLKFVK